MNQRNDGGPAFPRDRGHYGTEGMSLRDYYAGLAMQRILPDFRLSRVRSGMPVKAQCQYIAENAFAMADAMLKERQKPDPMQVDPLPNIQHD